MSLAHPDEPASLPRVELVPLDSIDVGALMALMNDPRVRRHLPLARGRIDERAISQFLDSKRSLWTEHGYGPYAFRANGLFAGWGGLQHEQGDADLALVLSPAHWGLGSRLAHRLLAQGFSTLGLDAVTALLPPTRRARSLLRFGFQRDGERRVGEAVFQRFRLERLHWQDVEARPVRPG